MTQRQYLIYMLTLVSIALSFFFGYFIFRYEQIQQNMPKIEVIDEINPKVCTVDIDSILPGVILGRIGAKQIRIRYMDQVLSPNPESDFEFNY